MASSPPASPGNLPPRPMSAMVKPTPRSNSRLSTNSKVGTGSRASDEDGRTAVKVAIRVRPPLQATDPGFDLIPQRFQRSMVQATSSTSLAIDAPQGKKLFVFDRVFGPEITQGGIWEYLNDSVNAFVQGYNVSLLAYGQSGAGKSYTMGTAGPGEEPNIDAMGVIPRAATALFEKLEGAPVKTSNRNSMSQLKTPQRYSMSMQSISTPKAERNWQLKATYVEIYNEQLRDLLVSEATPSHERGNVTIREDTKGNIILTGLRQMEINSIEDLMGALNFGSAIRQTDATAINAKSSRSHAVFSLNLVQRKPKVTPAAEKRFSVPLEAMTGGETWVTTDSKLHFVDLAGSERLKNTGAQGERAKEGISINAGLAALGKVISQLSSRNHGAHVSYRDSRLTRLLQDSLGGNAITYMIACVTPAEFHLSETLNTVQYAQRARAIQSKPRIQQIEEGDKQAIIERLKAEVAFLREQIRSAERGGGERRNAAANDRPDRHSERESELQNQLLDIQENYTTLSQRHAKLIAEMAKARDTENPVDAHFDENLDDTATERLNRSNSFAQAVEQVVLEYEKTIQTLEQSLSSTRGTLSSTETNLLEKETKCAYVETINTQLQARLQKLMDREANTENYLRDLEAKLDGHTSGEEKNASVILELRKEISRARENEAACEDYISTLEERLAEADQDAELMQREMDRLEQVIERQRSLGKLDNLLYELDNIQQDGTQPEAESEATNGFGHRRTFSERSARSHMSRASISQARRDALPDVGEEEAEEDGVHASAKQASAGDEQESAEELQDGEEVPGPSARQELAESEFPPPSPAQTKFVADKLENVTEELIHLRVEHESTLNEYDLLHAKYEEALKTLAELQDAVDEAKHPSRNRDSLLSVTSPTQTRPPSFLSDAKTSDTKDGTALSSRSLSSELSSAMESPATIDSPTETETPKPAESLETLAEESGSSKAPVETAHDSALADELHKLKSLAAEKEALEQELTNKYAQLEVEHQATLDMVEELKTEVAKAKYAEPPSPRSATPVIRRKSSQNVMIIDRAHRSFASLRNIAAENFEGQPDVMQNFELNLNAAMHELHARSERIQELEADVTNARKEMETKMTIISGLTRERSSLKSNPMDMSVVATMKDQLEQNEKQLKEVQHAHTARERELIAQLEALKESLQNAPKATAASSPEQTSDDLENGNSNSEVTQEKIAHLESELASWEGKHQTALEAMQATEKQMRDTIEELEAQIATVNEKLGKANDSEQVGEDAKGVEIEHETVLASLRKEISNYKEAIDSNATKVAELEAAHSTARSQLEEATQARDAAATESSHHKELVSRLEAQIAEHEQALQAHNDGLELLHTDHARDIEEIKAQSKQEYESQLNVLMTEHAENIKLLESDLAESREELLKVATLVSDALGVEVSLGTISERIEELISSQAALGAEQQKTLELETHINELSSINNTIMRDLEAVKSTMNDLLLTDGDAMKSPYPSVVEQLAAVKKRVSDLENKNKKHSRLVEELEDQLQTNYDQAQITSNRLSTLQSERNTQLEEATTARIKAMAELEALRDEHSALQARLDEVTTGGDGGVNRSNSMNSQLRKAASHSSLPSPPPAIPLPPLPGGGATSPTQSTSPAPAGGRPQSNDIAMLQIREDQDLRIKTIERHLAAEKQLTSTLEEALTDLERQSNKVKADCDAWRKRAMDLETEVKELKDKPQQDSRWRDSLHQVEEERKKRQDAERARAHLEERMNAINAKKKKKGSLNCF
ncbi:kinesin motor domain-containing protein [Xylariales sp. PMI_506]|nr:kinesin motor domain-containing protein [Xylariales sp. PMI_506]